MKCLYCEQEAVLTNGQELYPHREDLWELPFYICRPCNAYVGCHPGTTKPLGRLANAELRSMKSMAHRFFDVIWKSKEMTRGQAYAWLANQLNLDKHQCHIGMFDVDMCTKVIEVCRKRIYK